MGASATGGADALLAPESAQVLIAANDEEDDVRNRRLEATLGYGIPAFGGRYTTTPAIGFGLTEAEREYSHSWRLAEAKSAGLVFGLDVEGTRRESVTDGQRCGRATGESIRCREPHQALSPLMHVAARHSWRQKIPPTSCPDEPEIPELAGLPGRGRRSLQRPWLHSRRQQDRIRGTGHP